MFTIITNKLNFSTDIFQEVLTFFAFPKSYCPRGWRKSVLQKSFITSLINFFYKYHCVTVIWSSAKLSNDGMS